MSLHETSIAETSAKRRVEEAETVLEVLKVIAEQLIAIRFNP